MKKTEEIKDRVYKLKNNFTPLSYMLPSRHTPKHRLLYYDPDKKTQRALRYASNQSSPFEDEQDEHAVLEPITFEDGMLRVPKENQSLQHFLSLHPLNGSKFIEVDKEKDAQDELEALDRQDEAILYAKEMDIEQAEMVARTALGMNVSKMSSAEIKRDVKMYARNNPEEFMSIVDNADIEVKSKVTQLFEERLLITKNNNKEVYYNLKDNKKRMCTVPFGVDPKEEAYQFLTKEENLEVLKTLETLLQE